MTALDHIKEIVLCNPRNFMKVLKAKRNAYLLDFIFLNTSLLIDDATFTYSLKTRIYWLLNGISSWEDDRVKCQLCGKPFKRINVKKLHDYGRKTCGKKCERIVAQRSCVCKIEAKYGVKNIFQVPSIKSKIQDMSEIIQLKRNVTKRCHGTFKSSKKEDTAYQLLCSYFGNDDVVRQYRSAKYPFNCDFYIKSKDLYIECNFSWTHGGHWFDPDNEDDIKRLELMKSKHSKYYDNAIETWTIRDVKKHEVALKNQLNYIVFWTLDDVKHYVQLIH